MDFHNDCSCLDRLPFFSLFSLLLFLSDRKSIRFWDFFTSSEPCNKISKNAKSACLKCSMTWTCWAAISNASHHSRINMCLSIFPQLTLVVQLFLFLISIVFFSWSKLAEIHKTFHSKRVTIIMSWRVNKSTTKLKRTKYKTHIHYFPSNNVQNRKIPTTETKQNVKQTKCTTWNLLWGNLSLFQREIICFISRTLCTCECLTYFQWACIVRCRFLVYYYNRVLCIRLESTILWMQHMHFGIPYLVQQFIVVVKISCGCVMSLWFFFSVHSTFCFVCVFFLYFFFCMHQHTNSVQNPKDSRSAFLFLLAFEATKIL